MEKVFLAKIELIRTMIRWIHERLKKRELAPKDLKKIDLAVEEALVNIIRHAYLGKPEKIRLSVLIHPTNVQIIIKDSGPPFNPLSVPVPNVEASLEEREIGGLGILMMRQNMDQVIYRREGEMNVLILSSLIKI